MSITDRLRPLLTIAPVTAPRQSVAVYLPAVFASRGLAFLRLLVIARLLGEERKAEVALYGMSLDVINWPVALILFGLADVAERYAGALHREGELGRWVRRQRLRLGLAAGVAAALLAVLSPWIASFLWGPPPAGGNLHRILLLCAAALTVILLAFYQHLAALLRGLRAYRAVAGMELSSAALLLVLSALAAIRLGAVTLMLMYALSVLVPTLVYALLLRAYLREQPAAQTAGFGGERSASGTTMAPRFALWTLVRLLLMMTFPVMTLWAVRFLTPPVSADAARSSPVDAASEFLMPFRVAQILAYVAVTIWSSTYAIVAAGWSQGRKRRATVQLFRTGKFGMALLALCAVAALLARGLLGRLLPVYAEPIDKLLPAMLALFIWYGLLTFANIYADVRELPHRAALLWLGALALQLVLTFVPLESDAGRQVLLASVIAFGVTAMAVSPLVLYRLWKFSATGMPLVILGAAALSLLSPVWIVDYVAGLILPAAIGFLYVSGLLIRPMDRRGWRRLRGAKIAAT